MQVSDATYDQTTVNREKVGEIYRLSAEQLSFVCSLCGVEFSLFHQFSAHCQTHLLTIFSTFSDPDDIHSDRSVSDDVKTGHDNAEIDNQCVVNETIRAFSCDESAQAAVSESIFQCYICRHYLATRSECSQDLRVVHSDTTKSSYGRKFTDRATKLKRLSGRLVCPKCGKQYRQQVTLNRYMDIHANATSRKCDECPRVFKHGHSLREHMKRDHGHSVRTPTASSTYKCIRCDFVTRKKRLLGHHAIACAGENCACTDCGLMFVNRQAKMAHMEQHEKRFQCDECGRQFRYKQSFEAHAAVHSAVATLACDECIKVFKTDTGLRAHKKQSHELRDYECNVCGLKFDMKYKLLTHRNNSHEVSHTEVTRVICDICNKSVRTNYLQQHKIGHAGLYHHRCAECNSTFRAPSALKKHMYTHSDQRNFQCDECSKTFKTRDNMLTHKRTHLDSNHKYRCKMCGKTLTTSSLLNHHMRRHTGEGLIECTQCDLKFPTERDLRKHMISHSDRRDFKCDLCSKAFKQNHKLNAHKRIHTGDFKFKCRRCECGFHDKRVFEKHTLTAHGPQRE